MNTDFDLEAAMVEQANAIAAQAEAFAQGRRTVSRSAAAGRILANAETLLAWARLAEGGK